MAALVTQDIVVAGTAPTPVSSAASDTAEVGNGSNVFAVYKKTSAGTSNISITVPGTTSYGVANPAATFALAAGDVTPTYRWIPLRKAYDAGDGSGRCTLANDSITGVTVAIVRMG
jgi:hypothetical protein